MRSAAVAAALIVALFPRPSAAGDTDSLLVRRAGSVAYEQGGTRHAVVGSLLIAPSSTAVTGGKSGATVVLADSSQVDLGEKTSVGIAAIEHGTETSAGQLSVDHGAVKFTVRHPKGGHSDYRFATPTTQIAVRGTVGEIQVAAEKTVLICIDCRPGDVTVEHDGVVERPVTGQVVIVIGPPGATTATVGAAGPLLTLSLQQLAAQIAAFRSPSPSPCPSNPAQNSVGTSGTVFGQTSTGKPC